MTRRLTGEEEALWDRLRGTVKPLKKRRASKPAPRIATKPAPRDGVSEKPAEPPAPIAVPKPAKTPPALAPLEQKTRRRLSRGAVEIDSRIDLHGMRQERAFTVLAAFLAREQAAGARIVLVVTGKGAATEEGRGVLHRAVPEWLARHDLRHLVVGFEEAARRHGGAGALYVRIRRRRAAAHPAAPRA